MIPSERRLADVPRIPSRSTSCADDHAAEEGAERRAWPRAHPPDGTVSHRLFCAKGDIAGS